MKKSSLILLASIALVFGACKKESGCTNSAATNYNSDAEEDDGSCILLDGDTDGNGDGNGGTTDPVIPNKVLIYHGNGGVGSEGMWGDMTHAETITMCSDSGLSATHSTSWPSDLSIYRTVIIPAPGFNNSNASYSSSQITSLKQFITDGGNVLIEGENSATLSNAVINPLLSGLGMSVQFSSGYVNGAGSTVASTSLTDGVNQVGISSSGVLATHSDNVLVSEGSTEFVVYKKIGAGYVIVAADGNIFSDLADWDTGNKDNRSLLLNILKLK